MLINKERKRSALIANYWQEKSSTGIAWQLCWKPVCSSTESYLSRWLFEKPFTEDNQHPRAFIAGRQTHGKGQRGRVWLSPKGGVWISAALPFLGHKQSTGLFGLAVAFAMAERLESKKIPVQIKWPNDLLVFGKKLAGFLPGLIHRGQSLKLARVGIGLNVNNKVPDNGISLSKLLEPNQCHPCEWAGEVLLALDRAMELFEKEEFFYLEAQKRLWSKEVVDPNSGDIWEIEGLDKSGALKLKKDNEKMILTRW